MFGIVRLFIVLVTLFSLMGLSDIRDAGVAWANDAPVEQWVPAGPSTDTALFKAYIDQGNEFNDLATFAIDLSDAPLTPGQLSRLNP